MNTKPTPPAQTRENFLEWYHITTTGQILQSIEASYLQSKVKPSYNQVTLQLGRLGCESLYVEHCLQPNFVVVDIRPAPPHAGLRAICAAAPDIPVASESIDFLIIPHVLEFEPERQRVLRESQRILKPEGRLIILGMNPWNPLGITQYLPVNTPFCRGNPISRQRLLDWLGALNFNAEVSASFSVATSTFLNRPANAWERTRAGLSFAYALTAIKRRYHFIPANPGWLGAPSIASGAVLGN
jgi:SAM-dependent methyltransferase